MQGTVCLKRVSRATARYDFATGVMFLHMVWLAGMCLQAFASQVLPQTIAHPDRASHCKHL
jgi:hypothetical protein